MTTILYSRSVNPQELCVGVKILHSTYVQYAILHYISKEWRYNDDLRSIGNFIIEPVIG